MNLMKKLCLLLALVLALGTLALAETTPAEESAPAEDTTANASPLDPQAQLDAAMARIAELEAQVEMYRPYYDAQVLAEYGNGGIVWLKDAQEQFQQASAMYAQYGIPVDAYANEIKQSIVESMVQQGVLDQKAAELGIGEPDEAALNDLIDKASEDFENYVSYYTSYFATEGATDEENHEATVQGLNDAGISKETLLAERVKNYASEQLHTYVTKDVTVTDEDVQNTYQNLIETQKTDFADDDYAFNSTRMGEDPLAWIPEGYRTVKHVLIKFSDEQAKQYSELESTLESLNEELDALDQPKGELEVGEDGEAEDSEDAEDAEEKPAPRTRDEIETDKSAVVASIEALYSELIPKAQEVVDAFNGGAAFDELIEKYNEDPGMTTEPTASMGYAVCADSTYWDPAFTEGAMSIAKIGQISEPVRGQNGVHIIYYLSDLTPGEVPFEQLKDALQSVALEEKVSSTYDNQVNAWVEAANPVYHMDRFN